MWGTLKILTTHCGVRGKCDESLILMFKEIFNYYFEVLYNFIIMILLKGKFDIHLHRSEQTQSNNFVFAIATQ